MQSLCLTLVSLITLTIVSPVVAEDVNPDTRESLETVIPEGIRLLKAKEYATFITTFVPPADLKKFTAEASIEKFAGRFGERKASRLLAVLEEIKDAKPKLDETGTKATFAFDREIDGKESITFVKIEKYWYIEN